MQGEVCLVDHLSRFIARCHDDLMSVTIRKCLACNSRQQADRLVSRFVVIGQVDAHHIACENARIGHV